MHDYDDDPDAAFSDACEQYLFEVLTDCPDDQICWVLDQVDESKREEIIQKIRDAISFYEPEPDMLPPVALWILEVLVNSREPMILGGEKNALDGIVEALRAAGHQRGTSRKTISPYARRLLDLGLIDYPHGPRSGAVCTQKGREYVPQSQSE